MSRTPSSFPLHVRQSRRTRRRIGRAAIVRAALGALGEAQLIWPISLRGLAGEFRFSTPLTGRWGQR